MSIWKRFTNWVFNEHGVRRLQRESREADQWSGKIVQEGPLEHGGMVRGKPIIFFDEVPLLKRDGEVGVGVDFGKRSDHVDFYDQSGRSVRSRIEQRALDCSSFVASTLPDIIPEFEDGAVVWVNSKVYGRWLGRVESYQRVGDHFRYTIVCDGLLCYFQPPGRSRDLHRRHELVPEDILEEWKGHAAPTGSAEAAAAAHAFGKGMPIGYGQDYRPFYDAPRGAGGLWGFSSPPTSLESLKRFAEGRGVDWTSPAVQTQFMVEHFGKDGGMMILPVAEDQTEGQDYSSKVQSITLHLEFLRTIDHVENVLGDEEFAEKMRGDLLGLWHEDKLAVGLSAPEALGMTEAEYSAWVEKRK